MPRTGPLLLDRVKARRSTSLGEDFYWRAGVANQRNGVCGSAFPAMNSCASHSSAPSKGKDKADVRKRLPATMRASDSSLCVGIVAPIDSPRPSTRVLLFEAEHMREVHCGPVARAGGDAGKVAQVSPRLRRCEGLLCGSEATLDRRQHHGIGSATHNGVAHFAHHFIEVAVVAGDRSNVASDRWLWRNAGLHLMVNRCPHIPVDVRCIGCCCCCCCCYLCMRRLAHSCVLIVPND